MFHLVQCNVNYGRVRINTSLDNSSETLFMNCIIILIQQHTQINNIRIENFNIIVLQQVKPGQGANRVGELNFYDSLL